MRLRRHRWLATSGRYIQPRQLRTGLTPKKEIDMTKILAIGYSRLKRAFLGLTILSAVCSGCGTSGNGPGQTPGTVTAAGDQLGLSYAGSPSRWGTDDSEFSRTHATWLRAFYNVPQSVAATNSCDVKDDPDLNELKMIHQTYGGKYKIIFSLKYNATLANQPAPPLSGPQYDALVSCTNTILDYMYNSIDILVSGNEPFEPDQFANMSVATFYQQMTDNDVAYRAKQFTSVPIYVGSFNDLQTTYAQSPAAIALLTYANNNPAVAGVDLHLHVASFNGDDGSEDNRFSSLDSGLVGAVTFARTLVPTKPFLSTEFSLVSYFLPFLKDPLSASFTTKYAADAAASVAQDPDGNQTVLGFYNYAVAQGNLGKPITYQEWSDFLSIGDAVSPTWYTDRFVGSNNFLAEAQGFFNKNNFLVTTYSLPYQQTILAIGQKPGAPYQLPFYWLGAVFCNATCPMVQISGSNMTGNRFSLGVADDFISLQPR